MGRVLDARTLPLSGTAHPTWRAASSRKGSGTVPDLWGHLQFGYLDKS